MCENIKLSPGEMVVVDYRNPEQEQNDAQYYPRHDSVAHKKRPSEHIDGVKLKLTPDDRWFRRGLRIEKLTELKDALREVLEWVPKGTIPRGASNAIVELMGPVHRTRCHDDERAGITHGSKKPPHL